VRGRVRNLTDFVHVEIEDGVDGPVYAGHLLVEADIRARCQEGPGRGRQTSMTENRVCPSIKDTEPSAWDRFVEEHAG